MECAIFEGQVIDKEANYKRLKAQKVANSV